MLAIHSSKEAQNLFLPALCKGIDWNLAVSKSEPLVYERQRDSIDHLCSNSLPLYQKWVDTYIEEVEKHPNALLSPGEVEDADNQITPMPIQLQALEAPQKSRNDGRKRSLVVMATRLGKTYVSIFDTLHVQAENFYFWHTARNFCFRKPAVFGVCIPNFHLDGLSESKTIRMQRLRLLLSKN